jgi:hypothetical protein
MNTRARDEEVANQSITGALLISSLPSSFKIRLTQALYIQNERQTKGKKDKTKRWVKGSVVYMKECRVSKSTNGKPIRERSKGTRRIRNRNRKSIEKERRKEKGLCGVMTKKGKEREGKEIPFRAIQGSFDPL